MQGTGAGAAQHFHVGEVDRHAAHPTKVAFQGARREPLPQVPKPQVRIPTAGHSHRVGPLRTHGGDAILGTQQRLRLLRLQIPEPQISGVLPERAGADERPQPVLLGPIDGQTHDPTRMSVDSLQASPILHVPQLKEDVTATRGSSSLPTDIQSPDAGGMRTAHAALGLSCGQVPEPQRAVAATSERLPDSEPLRCEHRAATSHAIKCPLAGATPEIPESTSVSCATEREHLVPIRDQRADCSGVALQYLPT
mmetsp:Transcript_105978/g.285025  ORF Transcript_105978/g.285025 Transcript_105978/m.285025 type:complete len:252 (-) Transcript_105978:1039-1794(-)